MHTNIPGNALGPILGSRLYASSVNLPSPLDGRIVFFIGAVMLIVIGIVGKNKVLTWDKQSNIVTNRQSADSSTEGHRIWYSNSARYTGSEEVNYLTPVQEDKLNLMYLTMQSE